MSFFCSLSLTLFCFLGRKEIDCFPRTETVATQSKAEENRNRTSQKKKNFWSLKDLNSRGGVSKEQKGNWAAKALGLVVPEPIFDASAIITC